MIASRVYLFGLLMILIDISVIPMISNYQLWTDFTFFFLLSLLLVFKELVLPWAIIISLVKALFFFPEHLFLYLGIVLLSLILAHIFRKTMSLSAYSWEMIWGLGIIFLQMFWLARFSPFYIVFSCLFHLVSWIFLFPMFFHYFQRIMKLQSIRKGSAV